MSSYIQLHIALLNAINKRCVGKSWEDHQPKSHLWFYLSSKRILSLQYKIKYNSSLAPVFDFPVLRSQHIRWSMCFVVNPKQQIISSQSKTTASTSYNYKSVQDMKSSSQDIYNTACIIFGSVVGANYECPSILAFESFHFFDVIRDLFHLAFQIRNIQTKDNY